MFIVSSRSVLLHRTLDIIIIIIISVYFEFFHRKLWTREQNPGGLAFIIVVPTSFPGFAQCFPLELEPENFSGKGS